MTIKTIIIEDEPIAQIHLETICKHMFEQLEIVAKAANVIDAIELIYKYKPDMVFLDIDLCGRTGFEVLSAFENRQFEVIVVTAYDQHAISAIKNNALDYILKPIDKPELLKAVMKAEHIIAQKRNAKNNHSAHILSIPSAEGIQLVPFDNVQYLEASGRYTFIYTDTVKHTITKSIGEYEDVLPAENFIRIHSAYIVNIRYIDKYVKGRGGYVILKNGLKLEVSVRKKEDLLSRFT